ncbi:MAG: DNA polymerase III subunit delta' [Patescibacteria group bacterium]|nr:DNA polymerase III subunit delta' [Patescibacteria group bacterium]MDD4611069.1 DNA polymerase III subunit delta' [Patescibacteria group bacterium]
MPEIKEKDNWPLVGNSHIIDFLRKSLEKDKIAHTYIFSGPEDLGKTTVAYFFSRVLLCRTRFKKNSDFPCGICDSCRQFLKTASLGKLAQDEFNVLHSDFHVIKKEKDKKNISIEQVREFVSVLGMSSFSNSYKVGIIKDADSLSDEAANALLKTLEEPKKRVVIILVANNTDALLETIVSRSQILKFHTVKADLIYNYLVEKFASPRSAAKTFSHLALGRPAKAVKFLEDKEFYINYETKVKVFLNFFNQNINERLVGLGTAADAEQKQEGAKASLKIIEIWQGINRDMILSHFEQKYLIQNEFAGAGIEALKNKIKLDNLLKINRDLEIAARYIRNNVSPKLVLENIAINI